MNVVATLCIYSGRVNPSKQLSESEAQLVWAKVEYNYFAQKYSETVQRKPSKDIVSISFDDKIGVFVANGTMTLCSGDSQEEPVFYYDIAGLEGYMRALLEPVVLEANKPCKNCGGNMMGRCPDWECAICARDLFCDHATMCPECVRGLF